MKLVKYNIIITVIIIIRVGVEIMWLVNNYINIIFKTIVETNRIQKIIMK